MNSDIEHQFVTTPSLPSPSLLPSELVSAAQTLSARRARLLERLERSEEPALRRELGRVELALDWCRAGVYGRCCVCGTPLPASTLEFDPADLACDRCHGLHGERPRSAVAMRTLSFTDGPAALHEAFVRARAVARMPES
jgi:hypothetical protein